MENKDSIPFIVWESSETRHERREKRWFVLCIILFLSFVLSNMYWIYRENSYEDVVETTIIETMQDSADGGLNYIGRIINDAETDNQDNENN